MKTNLFNQIKEMQASFVIPGSYFLIEVSYERAENELYRNVVFEGHEVLLLNSEMLFLLKSSKVEQKSSESVYSPSSLKIVKNRRSISLISNLNIYSWMEKNDFDQQNF